MNKYKYKLYVWMIFDYKGASAIGRTIYGQNKEELTSIDKYCYAEAAR